MKKSIAFFDDPTDFSLVQGGPLFQIFLRTRMLKPPTDLLIRRVVAIFLITWVPLLVISALSGHAIGGIGVPFLFDLDVHVRCFLAIPLLLIAEVVVHKRIKGVVSQFLDRGIVSDEERPRFEEVIASTMRVRNSVFAELLVLALSIAWGFLIWKKHYALNVPTWFANQIDGVMQLTAAGNWYFYVTLIIMRFLWFRWFFRLFIWYRFLWQVARRIPLRLNALHPDRSAGLGFLAQSMFAFAPILIAISFALAGTIGGKILHEGATLPQFKMELIAWSSVLMLLVVLPLFFFVPHAAEARRTGLREYGILASRYVAEFRRKWIEGHAAEGESLVGSADIQSLADLSNSFEVVREMRIVPLGRATVLRLALVIALPLAPLSLTMIPLEQLIDRALGVFL